MTASTVITMLVSCMIGSAIGTFAAKMVEKFLSKKKAG